MANHPQALKRNRQRIKRNELNRFFHTTLRTFVKQVRSAVSEKDAKQASAALSEAVPFIDRCAQKGIVPRGRASRLVSRLSRSVSQLAQ